MESNIFIPKKIKVGFNLRKDTYTGKLGYVIYHDGKVWRKEKSWESWRQHEGDKLTTGWDSTTQSYKYTTVTDVEPLEFANEPLEGFVLNKKVGGTSSGWNYRQTYCRVYDPRGFEFEIAIPNLLYILENASSIKGKGLEGKFIYGWEGTELVLIPEEAPEYKDMIEFTNLQDLKLKKSDLKIGGIYITKQGEEVVFLREAPEYDYEGLKGDKKLWFYKPEKIYSQILTKPIESIKKYVGDYNDVASLIEILSENKYYNPRIKYIPSYVPVKSLSELDFQPAWWRNPKVYTLNKQGSYKEVEVCRGYNDNYSLHTRGKLRTEAMPFNKLIANYPIYKLVKITEDEKSE